MGKGGGGGGVVDGLCRRPPWNDMRSVRPRVKYQLRVPWTHIITCCRYVLWVGNVRI